MSDPPVERIEGQLTLLLRSLETLRLIGRHLSPPELADLLEQVGFPEQDLHAVRASARPWPEAFSALGAQLDTASDETLAAFDGLRASATDPGGVREVFRAMRHAPRALEALYPLAGILPPVNRFFLEPELGRDDAFQKSFLRPPTGETGVIRFGDDPNARETVWVHVPETYSADVAHPLVMALHGGGGRGRGFLWSWVRETRSRGAILVAPTSLGDTWAIQGADMDTPHLAHILAFVRGRWNIDAGRMMLTGMSDGGTFTYVSGLESSSPFTHLAPIASAFHKMMVQTANADRLRSLPIHIVHGLKDWMFPADMAREAERHFTSAGAAVTYREIADLSHTYPTDLNGPILDWLWKSARS